MFGDGLVLCLSVVSVFCQGWELMVALSWLQDTRLSCLCSWCCFMWCTVKVWMFVSICSLSDRISWQPCAGFRGKGALPMQLMVLYLMCAKEQAAVFLLGATALYNRGRLTLNSTCPLGKQFTKLIFWSVLRQSPRLGRLNSRGNCWFYHWLALHSQ